MVGARAYCAGAETTIEVPPMGESITEGTVVTFLKNVGDFVEIDEPVLQIETDKVTVDVPSPQAGTITGFLAGEDDNVEVGQPLFTMTTGGAAAAPAAESAAPAAESSPLGEPVTIEMPSMGESITEGTIAGFLKGPGDYVEVDEVIAQIETDKVTVDVPAPFSGTLGELLAAEDDTIEVGAALFTLSPGGSAPAAAPVAAAAPPAAAAGAAAAMPAAPAAKVPAAEAPAAPTPTATGGRLERRVDLTRMRKKIASALKDSQSTAALLTTFNEVDMSALMAMRTQYKDAFVDKHGVKLGLMSPFFAAAARALIEQPAVNSQIHGDQQVFFDYADIGFAAATPKGLVVPVLRNVESMDLRDIEAGIGAMGAKAKANKIQLEDMTGGTFSITNGGVFGSLISTPILTQPQSAILGMHGIFKRPIAVNGQIEVRPMMYIALTYDHRIIDGREAVTFLKTIKEGVEDPIRLLLNV
jgi:2-oxoglutarate dehydrogenase E2 component (dihydrolipoamide succinyltransferase)